MDGLRVLVTAGGTREPIDSVRYVGNRSSGRMGVALAAEAARRGAEVTLVAANVGAARARRRARSSRCETAAELLEAARAAFGESHVLLMAAAVADFRPGAAVADKISKSGRDGLALALEPTEDVLAALSAARAPGQTLIGFAAEHGEGAVERGRAKLARKGLDAVVRQRHLALRDRLRLRRQRGHDRHRGGRAPRAAGVKGDGGRGDPRRGRGGAQRSRAAGRPGAQGDEYR